MVNRVGVEPTLTRIKSPSLNHSATGPILAKVERIELPTRGFGDRCSTTELHRHMVVPLGVEPSHQAYETQVRTICVTISVFNCTISSAASVFASHNLSSRCNLLEYCTCENRDYLFPVYHRVTPKTNSKLSNSVGD